MPNKIPLADRRPDTGVIDRVSIDYALRGWASYAADLSVRDLRAAIHLGVAQGKSSRELAGLLLMHERQVDRFRADPCPVEEFTAAEAEPILIAA